MPSKIVKKFDLPETYEIQTGVEEIYKTYGDLPQEMAKRILEK